MLSLDVELAWGLSHNGKFARYERLYQRSRSCMDGLLKLLEKYEVRATWAITGHLFLDKCQSTDGVKHPEIIRPGYNWLSDDWFSVDPCSRLEDAPFWYGRDIVQQILSCEIKQEIGCHTFSHVLVGDPGCSRDCFASELHACHLAAKEFGVALESFVFPRNNEGHLDVLNAQGFLAYRGSNYPRSNFLPRILRSLIYHSRMAPTVLPEERVGLWNLPESMFYVPPKGVTWPAAIALQVWKAKKALRQAAREQRLFHMWFHPFNLSANPQRLLRGLENIFAEFSRYRYDGLLDNLTMGEMAHVLQLRKEHEGLTEQAKQPSPRFETSTL